MIGGDKLPPPVDDDERTDVRTDLGYGGAAGAQPRRRRPARVTLREWLEATLGFKR